MPIYEFFCEDCNTIYKFFSQKVNTNKIPACPKCDNKQLSKRMSTFATISGKESDQGDMDLPFDESKMEQAMAMLAGEADKINEDDPRQAARLMRKLSQATGLKLNDRIEDALARMERGEDPDQIEAELGDLDDDEEPFIDPRKLTSLLKKRKPRVDDTLYDL